MASGSNVKKGKKPGTGKQSPAKKRRFSKAPKGSTGGQDNYLPF